MNNVTKKTIVHILLSSPFMDDSTYQETMLANKHREQGNDVYIITTNIKLEPNGTLNLVKPSEYITTKGVKIIRLYTHRKIGKSRCNYRDLYNRLIDINPDFIMDHAFCITSSIGIRKYKKIDGRCKVVADSHITNANYKIGWKEQIYNIIQRIVGGSYYKCCDKIYGITSETIEIIASRFGVPMEKTELLPLGYDESMIVEVKSEDITQNRDSLVLAHGGKLSENKKTLELVEAVAEFENINLVIFGEFVDKTYETRVKEKARNNVEFKGFLCSKDIYKLFSCVDIAVFPGAPSCLRQEAVASGLPIIICCNEGDKDINLIENDNGIILDKNWTVDILKESIRSMIERYEHYDRNAKYLAKNDYTKYSYKKQAEYILNN